MKSSSAHPEFDSAARPVEKTLEISRLTFPPAVSSAAYISVVVLFAGVVGLLFRLVRNSRCALRLVCDSRRASRCALRLICNSGRSSCAPRLFRGSP